VSIDTPYLQGDYEVWCMENLVYELIVSEARPAHKPDPEWQVSVVETRQQRRNKDLIGIPLGSFRRVARPFRIKKLPPLCTFFEKNKVLLSFNLIRI
jgi:hypothetical protein